MAGIKYTMCPVSHRTYNQLRQLKKELNFKKLNDVINILLKNFEQHRIPELTKKDELETNSIQS